MKKRNDGSFLGKMLIALMAVPLAAYAQPREKPRPVSKGPKASPEKTPRTTAPEAARPKAEPAPAPTPTPAPGQPQPGATPKPVEPRATPKPSEPPPEPPPLPMSPRRRRVFVMDRPPRPVLPAVKTSYGSVTLLGLLQARFVMPMRGLSSDYQTVAGASLRPQNLEAEMQRARIILMGHLLSKYIKYAFQGDAKLDTFMLDAKFIFTMPWVKGLSFTFGRFLPTFSQIMPVLITRLETAEYPIFLTEGRYAPWRQLGLEIAWTSDMGPGTFRAIGGVYNGPVDGWNDDNHHKDFMVRVDYELKKGPLAGFYGGINAWFGFPHCVYDSADTSASTCTEVDNVKNKADSDIKLGAMLSYKRTFGKMMGIRTFYEFWYRRFTPWAENRDPWNGFGTWVHVGVPLEIYPLPVEPVVRFEYLKPRTGEGNKDNYSFRLTAGANLYINKIHSHLKVNYFYQRFGDTYSGTRSWQDMKYGDDPTVPDDRIAKKDVHMFLIQINTEF